MADVAVEKTDTSVVEKILPAEEAVDVAVKKDKDVTADPPAVVDEVEEATTTENGKSEIAILKESAKENGESNEAVAAKVVGATTTTTDNTDGVDNEKTVVGTAAVTTTTTTQDEATATADESSSALNGVEESSCAEANGNATDSAPAEAVKRKVTESVDGTTTKSDDCADITPEKKAKLDDASKEDVQNGAESTSTEVAA